jgi:hypothetical protein
MLNEFNKEFENPKIYSSNEIDNRYNKINELKNLDIQIKKKCE